MTTTEMKRRGFLGATAAAAIGLGTKGARAGETGEAFAYEIQRSEADWRERLNEHEYAILREGGTEPQHSNPLWNERRSGTYCCRGCDLTLYKSLHKLQLEKGWVFFRHSLKDTVLTDLDLKGGRMGDPFAELAAGLEVHCRRCGSHLGHIVALAEVPGAPIHCINGTSLRFETAET